MRVKQCDKACYEIEDKEDIIYISKEENPGTKDYVYFIDVFRKNEKSAYINDCFDESYQAIEYLQYNLSIPKKITNKIVGI